MFSAVLDTVVIVRATKTTHSAAAQVVDAWVAGEFQLVLSPAILKEYQRVLFYPKVREGAAWSEEKVKRWLILCELTAEIQVAGGLDLHVVRDPADDKFIVAAVEGQADYIVSADKDLLDLGRYKDIKIVPLREFLRALAGER